MSLVTTCPACTTRFRVRPEQLAAQRGEVRCGKCQQVFNALSYLTEIVPAAPEPQPLESEPRITTLPVVTEADPAIPPFLQQETPPSRRLLLPLILLLLLIALGQAVYFLRTEIAARLPWSQPYLARACATLGCRVDLPREIGLISIDDYEMQQDPEHENVIVLSAALFNRAGFTQAYPSLIVTLTDDQDHPLLRRTFTPQQYLPAPSEVETGIPAHGETRIKLLLHTEDQQVTGFHLDKTY